MGVWTDKLFFCSKDSNNVWQTLQKPITLSFHYIPLMVLGIDLYIVRMQSVKKAANITGCLDF